MFSDFFHCLLLSIYPMLFIYGFNVDQANFVDALIPMLISLAATAIIVMITAFYCRHKARAAAAISLFLFFFYSYGAFYQVANSLSSDALAAGIMFPLGWGLTFFMLLTLLIKTKKDLTGISKPLNLIAMVLISMPLLTIIDYQLMLTPEKHIVEMAESNSNHPRNSELPDIYYILVDGYASNRTLNRLYDFDNASFTSFLEQHGFYIAHQSRSNYIQTALSLSSSLNMTYLDSLEASYGDSNSAEPVIELIANSSVVANLKNAGYQTVAFASGYATTELDNADTYFGKTLINREFYNILINSTFISAFKGAVYDITATQAQAHSNLMTTTMQRLGELRFPENAQPAFVFAHLAIPHPPFIWERDGKLKTRFTRGFHLGDGDHWGKDSAQYRREYLDQLLYFNSLLQHTIKNILQSKRNKIIILQSDHGPASELVWESAEQSDLEERFSILNAYYFHDHNYEMLSPDISPVNSFRIIFNKLFGSNIDLLENRHIFSPWSLRYKFNDVTMQLNNDVAGENPLQN